MADATPQPGPTAPPPAPLKPGYLTSEFALKLLTLLAGSGGLWLTASKILAFLGPIAGNSAAAVAAVTIAGAFITFMVTASSAAKAYTAARTALKQGAKALLVMLALGLLFAPGRARAETLLEELKHPVITQGPTFPVIEYRAGSSPLHLTGGAGYELGAGFFQRKLLGQEWDLLDVNLAAFGSGLIPTAGAAPTALSVAALFCTLSNSLCVGGGIDAFGAAGGVFSGFTWRKNGFLLMAWSFNLDFTPPAPAKPLETGLIWGGATFAGPPRANTLNLAAP